MSMEKEFIPYEQALALKELRFDEPCFGCYELSELRDYKKGLEVSWIMTLNTLNGYRIYDDGTQTSAPLKQQVFRWFREKYGLISWVEGKKMFMYRMESPIESDGQLNCSPFITYEEAELECIKKLIEIVKEK